MELHVKFRDKQITPFDRVCFVSNKKDEKFHAITLGAGSYINNSRLELFSSKLRIPNILIGRFSSLSWDLIFLLGYNHRYKNVVSTSDFQSKAFFGKIISQMKNVENVPTFKTCKNIKRYHNHYQIIIGGDVWIGRGATILGGVKIGSGAIIGANSTVTKDIPPYAIAAGNPARVIKYRFDQETIKKFMAIKWWNWDVKKIMENAPLMNDVEEFLEKHYTPDLEKVPYEKISPGGVGIFGV